MTQPHISPMPEFLMDVRQKLWMRLAELAAIETMTEAEKIEEQQLAREFWDWQPVEYRLRPDILRGPWTEQDTHWLQRRIMWAAHTNRCIIPADIAIPFIRSTENEVT